MLIMLRKWNKYFYNFYIHTHFFSLLQTVIGINLNDFVLSLLEYINLIFNFNIFTIRWILQNMDFNY